MNLTQIKRTREPVPQDFVFCVGFSFECDIENLIIEEIWIF